MTLVGNELQLVGNELQTLLFRKKIYQRVYLNFSSHLPNTYKKALLYILLYHVYNIWSNYFSFH